MLKLKYLFLLLFFVISTVLKAQPWTQIGEDIVGEAAGDNFGISVNLNNDGSVVAIGARYNNNNGNNAGNVRVFENNSGIWSQVGNDIDGKAAEDNSGIAVSLSSDGSIVAVGAHYNDDNGINAGNVRIFGNDSGTWTQIGNDIVGEAAGDNFGIAVSLSSDGTVVACGARTNDTNGTDAGHVRIFKNISGTWTQIGNDINGEASGDRFGYAVALNSDGTIVAIGAPCNGDNGYYSGHVRIFKNISETWSQVGNDINGENSGDEFGWSVDINSDGSTVACGAPFRGPNGTNYGQVRIFKNISNTWTQFGNSIDGEYAGDQFGYSVSLNSKRLFVAVGARHNNNQNHENAGQVRVYQYQTEAWSQISSNFNGDAEYNEFGCSVSLSDDGLVIAAGAIGNDENGTDAGQVKIFNTNVGINKLNKNPISIYPNPSNGTFNIENAQNYRIIITDLSGKQIFNSFINKKHSIFKSNHFLKKGVFLVNFHSNTGNYTSKLIIE